MFHKQGRNSNGGFTFVKKQLWLSRLRQELKDCKREKFGSWFQKLYEVFCTIYNCQPEQFIKLYVSKESVGEEPKGKEESESENDGSSINKTHIKMIMKEKKTCLCQKSKQKRSSAWENICSSFKNIKKFNRCNQEWFFITPWGVL